MHARANVPGSLNLKHIGSCATVGVRVCVLCRIYVCVHVFACVYTCICLHVAYITCVDFYVIFLHVWRSFTYLSSGLTRVRVTGTSVCED